MENETGKTWKRAHVNGKQLSQTSLEKFERDDPEAFPGLIQAMTWGRLGERGLGDFSDEELFNKRLDFARGITVGRYQSSSGG